MFPTHHHLIGQNGHGCIRSKPHFYQNSPHLEMFDGEVEADESYFGGQRKGKRGRGAAGKVAVFGLLKRNGKNITFAADIKKTPFTWLSKGNVKKSNAPL